MKCFASDIDDYRHKGIEAKNAKVIVLPKRNINS